MREGDRDGEWRGSGEPDRTLRRRGERLRVRPRWGLPGASDPASLETGLGGAKGAELRRQGTESDSTSDQSCIYLQKQGNKKKVSYFNPLQSLLDKV